MRLLLDRAKITASVVGLGHVGSCVAAIVADRGIDVTGIDTDPRLVAELDRGHCRFAEKDLSGLLARGLESGRLTVTTDYAPVAGADVVIVVVGTPIRPDGAMAADQLRDACERLSAHIRPGQLIVFKSTVAPGTTRNLVVPLLEQSGYTCGRDFGVAFCPERLSEGTAIEELRTLPLVVGGWCEESREAAAAFWAQTLGVEILTCASLETAELVKLADNWWIDHNIALANELAQLCDALRVDALEVIAAANTIPKGNGNVNILLPSVGVGGSCLPKDPWMLWRAARERGVDMHTVPTARAVNDAMPEYTVELITNALTDSGTGLTGAKVAILGLAFKNNTGDVRATPVEPVVAKLRAAGAEVLLFDPLVDRDAAERVFGLRPTETLEAAVDRADCLAVLAWHDEFADIDFASVRNRTARDCTVVDGRAYFQPETIAALRGLGFGYRGIGR